MECKCGVIISEKNWFWIKGRKSAYKICLQCKNKSKMCIVTYPTKELNDLSIKNSQIIRNFIWQNENLDKWKAITKADGAKKVKLLKDSYVIAIIHNNYKIPRNIITPELIEVKRNQIILRRWLRQTSS